MQGKHQNEFPVCEVISEVPCVQKSPFSKWGLKVSLCKRESVKKSVHGSRTSPRTDRNTLIFKDLAVRPEALEGRMAILLQLREI